MNKGDAGFGLFIVGCAVGVIGLGLGIIYGIVTVAKWAWGG